jgi:RNA polymerase sigma-70 factor (ECF subfamily)
MPMEWTSALAGERVAAEEAQLLALVAAGDRDEPLVDLYSRYARRVYGLGLQLLGDGGLAEDLVQETFVRLWRSAPRFDPARASVRTFLFTLARRAAVDLWRRRRAVPLPLEPESEAAVDDDGFDALLLALDVRAALDQLTPKHREVLELHYDHGLTQQQIAEKLGVPLGTVKTRTFHALRALKGRLEELDLAA